jgi:Fe-S cluster assembly scaffold protein SufB
MNYEYKKMINHESHIQNISRSLNESDAFLKWRLDLFTYAQTVPKEDKEKFSYGLGIASDVLHVGVFRVSEPYTYKCGEVSGGARIFCWKEAMKDERLSTRIASLFEAQKKTKPQNYFFAEMGALFSDGLVVVADEGISQDIFLETSVPVSGADMIIIFAGARSNITIHETFSFKAGNVGDMKGRTILIVAEEKARVVYAEKITAHSDGGSFFVNKQSFVKDGARVSFVEVFERAAGFLKSETAIFLEGVRSKADIITLIQNDGTAVCDSNAKVFHNADKTVSNISAVGTASGLSKTIYRGLINVPKGINSCVGKQEGNFFMLSSGAEIDAIPSLEVASDDSQTSHALSIRRLSEDSTFYPRTRGFSAKDAESIIVRGFIDHTLAVTVPNGTKQFLSDLFL